MAPPYLSESRAIKIPVHGRMEHGGESSTSRRRRSKTSRHVNVGSLESYGHGKTTPNSSESWSSLEDATSQMTTRYTSLPAAVASPAPDTAMISTTPARNEPKGKQPVKPHEYSPPPNTVSHVFQSGESSLGPSMLHSSSYKSVNLNSRYSDMDNEEPARLITYTKHSQGFTWNDELFLPSYMVGRHRYGSGGRRHRTDDDYGLDGEDGIGDFDEQTDKIPVTDIFVTDEEAAAMMP